MFRARLLRHLLSLLSYKLNNNTLLFATTQAAPGDMLFNPDALKKVEGWNADNQVAPMDKLEAAERDQLSAALDRLVSEGLCLMFGVRCV